MELAGFVIFIVVGAFVSGYAFRGAIAKEVKQIGKDIAAEYAKAKADAEKLAADVKAKL